METQRHILDRLSAICRSLDLDDLGEIQWADGQMIRKCAILAQRGDPSGWRDFLLHIQSHRKTAMGFTRLFESLGWAHYSIESDRLILTLPKEFVPIDDATHDELLLALNPSRDVEDENPSGEKPGKVMYIEEKPGLTGHARIGRVRFSGTGKSIYYAGRKLQSLKGSGYKANYFNVETGLEYWISKLQAERQRYTLPWYC